MKTATAPRTIIQFSTEESCPECGHPAARVAHVRNGDGDDLGTSVTCPRCDPPGRHRAD